MDFNRILEVAVLFAAALCLLASVISFTMAWIILEFPFLLHGMRIPDGQHGSMMACLSACPVG